MLTYICKFTSLFSSLVKDIYYSSNLDFVICEHFNSFTPSRKCASILINSAH